MQKKLLLCTLLIIPSAVIADDSGYGDYAIKAAISTGIGLGATFLMNALSSKKYTADEKFKLASQAANLLSEKGLQKMQHGSYQEKIDGFIDRKIASEMLSLAIIDVELSYIEEQRKTDDAYFEYERHKKAQLDARKSVLEKLNKLRSSEYRTKEAEVEFLSFAQALQQQNASADDHESTVAKLRQRAATAN